MAEGVIVTVTVTWAIKPNSPTSSWNCSVECSRRLDYAMDFEASGF